jgi:NADP-dependent aldehyde dehydrogenase
VDAACTLAGDSFDAYRATSLEQRAAFLEAIAQGLVDLGDVLVERVMSESGLPRPRVEGERARTAGQLRLFATLVREGRWLNATIDPAMPDRKPLPRADLRAQKIPLGPVAVFGASNFPLAFSVAGGDTASALAAGCPVVAKSHPSHLGTSELAGRVIQKAVADCKLPEGTFSLLVGEGNAVGEALVLHPAIQAVGFTGSRRGGRALVALAAGRDVPIPVFAESAARRLRRD